MCFRSILSSRSSVSLGVASTKTGSTCVGQMRQQTGLHQRRLAATRRSVHHAHGERRVGVHLLDAIFQKRIESGSPSRSRGPGSSSRKKSLSSSSKERRPLGTILIGWLSEASSLRRRPGASQVRGSGAAVRGRAPRCSLARGGCLSGQEMPQIVGHVLGRGTLRRSLRERLQADAFQFLRDSVIVLAGRAWLEPAICSRSLLRVASEGRLATSSS